MLLCRVTLGNALELEKGTTDRRAEERMRGHPEFQSLIGTAPGGDAREFLVYDAAQVYPEYVMYYSQQGDAEGAGESAKAAAPQVARGAPAAGREGLWSSPALSEDENDPELQRALELSRLEAEARDKAGPGGGAPLALSPKDENDEELMRALEFSRLEAEAK